MEKGLIIRGKEQNYQVRRYSSSSVAHLAGAALQDGFHALSRPSIVDLQLNYKQFKCECVTPGIALFACTAEGRYMAIAHVPDIYLRSEGLLPKMDQATVSGVEAAIYDVLSNAEQRDGFVIPVDKIEKAQEILEYGSAQDNTLVHLVKYPDDGATIAYEGGRRLSLDIESILLGRNVPGFDLLSAVLGHRAYADLEKRKKALSMDINVLLPAEFPDVPTAYLMAMTSDGHIVLNYPARFPVHLLAVKPIARGAQPKPVKRSKPMAGPMDLKEFESGIWGPDGAPPFDGVPEPKSTDAPAQQEPAPLPISEAPAPTIPPPRSPRRVRRVTQRILRRAGLEGPDGKKRKIKGRRTGPKAGAT